MKHYVLGFALDLQNRKVLLIEKTKPEWQKGKLNGLGGSLEKPDKSIRDAMAREFKEESGIETAYDDWQLFGVMRDPTWVVFLLFSQLPSADFSSCDLGEGLVNWYDLDNLPVNVISNLNWLVGALKDEQIINKEVFIEAKYRMFEALEDRSTLEFIDFSNRRI